MFIYISHPVQANYRKMFFWLDIKPIYRYTYNHNNSYYTYEQSGFCIKWESKFFAYCSNRYLMKKGGKPEHGRSYQPVWCYAACFVVIIVINYFFLNGSSKKWFAVEFSLLNNTISGKSYCRFNSVVSASLDSSFHNLNKIFPFIFFSNKLNNLRNRSLSKE